MKNHTAQVHTLKAQTGAIDTSGQVQIRGDTSVVELGERYVGTHAQELPPRQHGPRGGLQPADG